MDTTSVTFNASVTWWMWIGQLWWTLLGQHSDLSSWQRFLVTAVQVVAVGLIFRTWLGPFILRRVYKRMRIQTISPRSVRGLYLHTGSSIWRIDRVGLSYHRPSTESARRFSIRVEGMFVTILNANRAEEQVQARRTHRMSSRLSVYGSSQVLSKRLWDIYSGIYQAVDPYLRPVIRNFFVALVRGIIRCLPALTQVLDFEVDRVVVSFAGVPGAHVTIGSATIYTKVVFTSVGGTSNTRQTTIFRQQPQRRFLGMAHLKNRLSGSIRRVWDRAWGQTQGSTSITVTLRTVTLWNDSSIDDFTELSDTGHGTVEEESSSQRVAAARYDMIAHLRSGVCVELPDSNELAISLHFGPTRDIIIKHSLRSALTVPVVSIKADTLSPLLRRLDSQQRITKRSDPEVEIPEILHPPVSPMEQGEKSSFSLAIEKLTSTRRKNGRINVNQACGCLLSFDLCVVRTTVALSGHDVLGYSYSDYAVEFSDIHAGGRISTPEDELFREYLGRSFSAQEDPRTCAYTLTFKTSRADVHRIDPDDRSTSFRVLAIGSVEMQGLSSQWPFRTSAELRSVGCMDEPLVVARIIVSSIHLSERSDGLVQSVPFPHANTRSIIPSKADSHDWFVWANIPRVVVDAHIQNISACILPADSSSNPNAALLYRTDGFVLSGCGNYIQNLKSRSPVDLATYSAIPLGMKAWTKLIFEPGFVTSAPPRDVINVALASTPFASVGEPLFSYSGSEVTLDADIPGALLEHGDTLLNVADASINVIVGIDVLSLELWNPTAVTTLTSSLSGFDRSHTKAPSNVSRRTLLQHPYSVVAHIGVGKIIAIITAADINPNEDCGMTRGIAAKTGIVIEVCMLGDSAIHYARQELYGRARALRRLGLPEELRLNAVALMHSDRRRSKYALTRVSLQDVTLRTAMATRYSADADYDSVEDIAYLNAREFFWLNTAQIEVNFRHVRSGSEQLQVQIDVRIPSIRSNVQVLHTYCILLAASTVRQCRNSLKKRSSVEPSRTASIAFKGTVGNCQAILKMPLGIQVYCCISNFAVDSRESSKITLSWRLLQACVPSPSADSSWEEVLSFRTCKLMSQHESFPPAVVFSGEAMRLFIPFGYCVADLILDCSVMLKAIRHLATIIPEGVYQQMDEPGVEDATRIPNILVVMDCLLVEIADDPLESKLSLIWKAGLDAASTRLERDEAFWDKVAVIEAADQQKLGPAPMNASDSRFSSRHTVSIEDALKRLYQVHAISWASTLHEHRHEQRRREDKIKSQYRTDSSFALYNYDAPELVRVRPPPRNPPLLRIVVNTFSMQATPPTFSANELAEYLHDVGKGLPRETVFSLLVPTSLKFSMGSSIVSLRDYPIPMLHIPHARVADQYSWTIETIVVIGEELGTKANVIWKTCEVVPDGVDNATSKGFALLIPKTTMPVKTYATPIVRVQTDGLTQLCWGISYNPTLQDVMRAIDSLTPPPPDPSPNIGFWDKVRLVLHWRVRVQFLGKVQLNLKGSRDPHLVDGEGAGFAFCWDGNTELTIGHRNADMELLQVFSDTMLVVIPEFVMYKNVDYFCRRPQSDPPSSGEAQFRYRKVCAKFMSGIKWGIGVKLERNCGVSCGNCGSTQSCRLFDFKPHYEVQLLPKVQVPEENSREDTYNEFRSDYIHLSTSLSTSSRRRILANNGSNSFHLSPMTFAHFWSWWDLFDRAFSLPIRQGAMFPTTRPLSKKFGRHLATLKYRISVSRLFIAHAYIDDLKESWRDGTVNWIGVKAFCDHFEADLHQREQEGYAAVQGTAVPQTKKIKHKPFYAAEVKLIGLKLQAMTCIFSEPLKAQVDTETTDGDNIYRRLRNNMSGQGPSVEWLDMDDFVETDWRASDQDPFMIFLDLASCPRFTYLKQQTSISTKSTMEASRFGDEDTHICAMGKEQSVQHVQEDLVTKRLSQLRDDLKEMNTEGLHVNEDKESCKRYDRMQAIKRKIILLEQYVIQQRKGALRLNQPEGLSESTQYMVAKDVCTPEDWAEFANVFHFHCPTVTISNTAREVLTQYYYCSRARRGFEYHMATRAVKFIRDQVVSDRLFQSSDKDKRNWKPAQALRKILIGDEANKRAIRISDEPDNFNSFDPLCGWTDGVALQKRHFFLLLKPQIVLRGSDHVNGVCVLAAIQAQLHSYAILDTANLNDSVTGRIMARNYAVLSGLQMFRPTAHCNVRDGVPFEVLVDLRAESEDFDRLVPQTDATFRYDKFNRLRLNNVASVSTDPSDVTNSHLQHQTDLIDVNVPRFTVTADYKGFQAIANVITTLVLVSDSAHKLHLDQVETLCFSYDFTDLLSTAGVVENLQSRLRRSVELEKSLENGSYTYDGTGKLELLRVKAQTLQLARELSLIFDAIKFAQEKEDGKHSDLKSALKLHTQSKEISWVMMDVQRELIAKLAVRGIDYSWLSRQDSSTVNDLEIDDLQAFDGSPDAEWPEILCKYREPSNHPLVKRGLFVLADWTILAPVGGITIYERFVLELHPMRLQLEAKLGRRIMEYVWPDRRNRNHLQSRREEERVIEEDPHDTSQEIFITVSDHGLGSRSSLDSPRSLQRLNDPSNEGPALRHLGASRSFTDLHRAGVQDGKRLNLPKSVSTESLVSTSAMQRSKSNSEVGMSIPSGSTTNLARKHQYRDDATEMKSRSSQKTFVLVRVASMHLLLSVRKDGSFFCRDARIRTRELEYRNQTWSFEELAEQFLPSDPSWRGWVKMALHQPLIPIWPVTKELLSKTKWIASKSVTRQNKGLIKEPPKDHSEPEGSTADAAVPRRERVLLKPKKKLTVDSKTSSNSTTSSS